MSYSVSADSIEKIQLNETNTVRSVLQNVAIILSVWRGTVPMDRSIGLSGEVLHKPAPVAQSMLCADVKETVEKYEPRCEVVNVSVTEDGGILKPSVEVNIIE